MRSFLLLIVLLTAFGPTAQSQTGAWLPAQSLPAYPRTLLTADSLPAVRASLHRGPNTGLYRGLYANSQGPAPTDNTSASGRRARATFAKNAAFLLLLDRQPAADSLVAWPAAARAAYLSQTVQVLETLNSAVEPFASLGGGSYTEWQWRSKELIDYLIAYDLLRGAGATSLELAVARQRLQQFTGNLYREAHKSFFGLVFFRQIKNNHTLMTAAALGMAAVVLNEATSTDINEQPVNWINAGLFHLDNVLWEDAQRQSDPTAVAGYAEGPYYFKYAFLNCLPFIRALGHFAPGARLTCSYNGVTRTIPNPYTDPRYDRLYDWITAISMPDGRFPALEDSYTDMGMPELALTGKSRYVQPLHFSQLDPRQLNSLTAQLRDVTVDMRAAYLAALPRPVAPPRPALTHLPGSGNLIFRSGSDSLAAYFHLYGKSGAALNNSGGHSQADATSFVLHARGQLLALDAGYLSYSRRADVGQAQHHNLILVDGAGPAIGTAGVANDAAVTLPTAFSTPGLSFGEAQTSYQNAAITRKTLFIRNQYFLVADFVTAAAPRTYTWQLHGYGLAGGTATTGTFREDFAHQEATWEKNGVQLLAHVTTPGPATFSHVANPHEITYNTPENHSTLLVQAAATARTQFLAALYPTDTAAVLGSFASHSTDTIAAVAATSRGYQDLAFTQADTLLTTAAGLSQPLAADALLTFVSIDSTGQPAQLFLDQGTRLRYGSQELLRSSRRALISWQPLPAGTYASYVSRATTLTVRLSAAPVQVQGPAVSSFRYDAATSLLTVELTGASELLVQTVTRPLPVTLVSFEGRRQVPGVSLRWKTALELNNEGFAVQRRTSQETDFRTISFVPAQGSGPATYQFIDADAPATAAYYRLQQQDTHGAVTYSSVVVISAAAAQPLVVAPVPANEVVRVTAPMPLPVAGSVQLLDGQGRVVMQRPLVPQTELPTATLPAGLYYVRAVGAAGQLLAPPTKVVVVH